MLILILLSAEYKGYRYTLNAQQECKILFLTNILFIF